MRCKNYVYVNKKINGTPKQTMIMCDGKQFTQIHKKTIVAFLDTQLTQMNFWWRLKWALRFILNKTDSIVNMLKPDKKIRICKKCGAKQK